MEYSKSIDRAAEDAVIGCLLLDNCTFDEISHLEPQDFSSYIHANAYRAIRTLISEGKHADTISVCDYLCGSSKSDNDKLYIELLTILTDTPYASKNIKYYAESIKQGSIDRELVKAAEGIITNVREKKEDRLGLAQQRISEIAITISSNTTLAADVLPKVMESLDRRQTNPSDVVGLSTGYEELDRLTHGLQPGQLIILAARPSMGKTLMAMNIAEDAAFNQKKSVLIFSMEMNKEELIERSLSSLSRVNQDLIKTGRLTENDWRGVSSLLPQYSEAKLFIEDGAALNVHEIRSKCRRIKREHGLSLVIVDYLQLVGGAGENETDKIGKISRAFKLLARDLNVPLIVVSQLNRGVEQRENKRPGMGDLRQSGAIEQDADLILFIYREEVYLKDTPNKGIAEINLAKNRHGGLGTFYLRFNGSHCRFDNHIGGICIPISAAKIKKRNDWYDEI